MLTINESARMQCLQESARDELQEIQRIVSVASGLLQPDESILPLLCQQNVPDPKHTLLSILQQQIPYKRHIQQPMIALLAYCFYQLKISTHATEEIEQIQDCFRQYLQLCTFLPKNVIFIQAARKCATCLSQHNDLIQGKRELERLREQIREERERGERQNERQAEREGQACFSVLQWRVWACEVLLRAVLRPKGLTREEVVKLLKQGKQLKKEGKVAIRSTARAFAFLFQHLAANGNDLSIYFELELKQMLKQPLSESTAQLLKRALTNCPPTNSALRPPTLVLQSPSSLFQTQLTPLLLRPSILPTTRSIHERKGNDSLSQDKTLRRIDHLMKFRKSTLRVEKKTPRLERRGTSQGMQNNSQMMEKSENSQVIKMRDSPGPGPLQQGVSHKTSRHETTCFGWFKRADLEISRTGSACKKNRRAEIYKSIAEKTSQSTAIRSQHLTDEMNEIEPISTLKCKLSLQEILLGERTEEKHAKAHEPKKCGTPDADFSSLRVTLLAIFNQEMAYLQITVRRHAGNYYLSCVVSSTFTLHANHLAFENLNRDFTLQQVQKEVIQSDNYLQALQERVERTVSSQERQLVEELLRQQSGATLSEPQTLKVILAVDLFRTYFFWYYTKSNLINGSRIERRNTKSIKFEDASAFAVCMSKFKSDYDSCLRELIEVENIQSLTETCLYLSHGRLLVYKEVVNVRGCYYLQLLSISPAVYPSFKRTAQTPSFQCTRLTRSFLPLPTHHQPFSPDVYSWPEGRSAKHQHPGQHRQHQQQQQELQFGAKEIELREIVDESEVFVFFMKNIVENFIELKYFRKIAAYSHSLIQQYNQSYNEELLFRPAPAYRPQELHSTQAQELLDPKPLLPPTLAHLRNPILAYVEAYNLLPKLAIARTHSHLLTLGSSRYFVAETQLKNGLRVLKLFKFDRRSTYHLMLEHKACQGLEMAPGYPYNRVASSREHRLFVNLVRKQKPQPYLLLEYSLTKFVATIAAHYVFVAVRESLTFSHYRLDMYFPQRQLRLATQISRSVYEPTSLGCAIAWRQCLQAAKVDFERLEITTNGRKFKLYEVLKQIQFGADSYEGSIELIQYQGKLHYLITNNSLGCLEFGTVDQIPFAYSRAALRSFNSHKIKHSLYDSLITRLYYQQQVGKVVSQAIEASFFQVA